MLLFWDGRDERGRNGTVLTCLGARSFLENELEQLFDAYYQELETYSAATSQMSTQQKYITQPKEDEQESDFESEESYYEDDERFGFANGLAPLGGKPFIDWRTAADISLIVASKTIFHRWITDRG
jgi:hypothetical protein